LDIVGAQHAAPLPRAMQTQRWNVQPGSLGAIIHSFKSAVTKRINEYRETQGAPVWQRNYHDHIIQDSKELYTIRQYIKSNPAKWEEDEYFPI
jgi:putative transposase